MIRKRILEPQRLRRIDGGFSFIPHRFLTDGFLATLAPEELLLYFFLILGSDRHGLSFYSADAICAALKLSPEQYLAGRKGLINKELIAFDGTLANPAIPYAAFQPMPQGALRCLRGRSRSWSRPSGITCGGSSG